MRRPNFAATPPLQSPSDLADNNPLSSGDHKNSSSRARWNSTKKTFLVKLLCDYNTPSYRAQHIWNKEAWKRILQAMDTTFPHDRFQMRQIKDLEQDLRKQYKAVKKLSELEGFKWDSDKDMVIASDELWQSALETDPNARRWYMHPFPYYNSLRDLYDEERSSQDGEMTPDPPASSQPESVAPLMHAPGGSSGRSQVEEEVGEHNLVDTNLLCDRTPRQLHETQDVFEPLQSQPTIIRRQASSSQISDHNPLKKSRPNKSSEFYFGQDRYIATSGKQIVPTEEYSITKCINVFNELQGFGEDDLFRATWVFKEKENREIFLALKQDQRMGWIKRMINYI